MLPFRKSGDKEDLKEGFAKIKADVSSNSGEIAKLGKEISELKAKLDAKAPLAIVDVRFEGDFNNLHIAGAISLPLVQLKNRYQELPHEWDIVFY